MHMQYTQCNATYYTQNHLIFFFPVFSIFLFPFMLLLNVHVHSIKIKIQLCISKRKYITKQIHLLILSMRKKGFYLCWSNKKKGDILYQYLLPTYNISNRQRTFKKYCWCMCLYWFHFQNAYRNRFTFTLINLFKCTIITVNITVGIIAETIHFISIEWQKNQYLSDSDEIWMQQ